MPLKTRPEPVAGGFHAASNLATPIASIAQTHTHVEPAKKSPDFTRKSGLD